MNTTRVLGMKFNCSDSKERTLTLADYKESATDAEIKAAMTQILEAAVFTRGGAVFTGIASAVRTVTTKTDVSLAD